MRTPPRWFSVPVLMLVLTLALLEVMLRWFDPLGAAAQYDAVQGLLHSKLPDDYAGFVVAPGPHDFGAFDVIATIDGYRRTVDKQWNTNCTLAALGDSMTFGWGVEDSETWPSVLAQNAAYRVVNAAMPGYNGDNIAGQYARLQDDVDGFLYLAYKNDLQESVGYSRYTRRPAWFAIQKYLTVAGAYNRNAAQIEQQTVERGDAAVLQFATWLDVALNDNRVQVFAFDDELWNERPANVVMLDYPHEHPVSAYDAHPDAVGQSMIAEQIRPAAARHAARVCGIE